MATSKAGRRAQREFHYMNETAKRILALQDKVFDLALKVHLLSRHESYLYECTYGDCVDVRVLLGDDLFMVKYGHALGMPEKVEPASAVSGEHEKGQLENEDKNSLG